MYSMASNMSLSCINFNANGTHILHNELQVLANGRQPNIIFVTKTYTHTHIHINDQTHYADTCWHPKTDKIDKGV